MDSNTTYIVTIRDISNLLQLHEEKQFSRKKSILLATASHELRNPLNGLIHSLVLMEKDVKSEGKQWLDTAKSASELLLFLVNDILDYSQLEAGKLKLTFKKFNPHTLLKEAMNLFSFQASLKNLSLVLDISPNVSKEFLSDENRIKQILINLISNAIKYTN
jgi:two-component system sensor histidine kinase/response regulator